jgi:hypothetical protein
VNYLAIINSDFYFDYVQKTKQKPMNLELMWHVQTAGTIEPFIVNEMNKKQNKN